MAVGRSNGKNEKKSGAGRELEEFLERKRAEIKLMKKLIKKVNEDYNQNKKDI